MSKVVPVRLTDMVLKRLNAAAKAKGCSRSAYIRDACLQMMDSEEQDRVSYVMLTEDNAKRLRTLASQMSMDHDKLINQMLTITFEQCRNNPFDENDKADQP